MPHADGEPALVDDAETASCASSSYSVASLDSVVTPERAMIKVYRERTTSRLGSRYRDVGRLARRPPRPQPPPPPPAGFLAGLLARTLDALGSRRRRPSEP